MAAGPRETHTADDGARVPIRVTLGVAVTLLVALTVGIVAWSNFTNTRAAIVGQTNERVEALLRELSQRVASHLATAVPAVELSRTLVRDGLVKADLDSLARQFALVLRNSPSFSWMSFSDEAGNFTGAYRTPRGELHVSQSTFGSNGGELHEFTVAADGSWTPSLNQSQYGYDPRTDRFYVAARDAKQRVWAGPYVFFDEGVPGITCASPLYDASGRLRGVFTVDFNLNALSRFVAELPFGSHGRVFVVTTDGTVIGHPTKRLVQVTGQGSRGELVTVANAGDPLMRAWFAELKKGAHEKRERDQFAFDLDGQRYLAGHRIVQFDQVRWVLGAVAPASDFLGVLARNRREALMVLAAALAFGVLVSLVLARRISAPLATLAGEMERVGAFELTARPRLRTRFREVALMDRALLTMKSGLRSFSYYVPTDIVRAMLASGHEARLEGSTSDLTVAFVDIASFTSLAEAMAPDALVHELSRYFDEITRIIAESGGTIDKFIGDAVMAFWGAPTPVPDHAARACEAAILCQRRLAELRAAAETPWLAALHARVGVASGDILVGNVGTPSRFNYTVMGDTVNLASRLEGLGKVYGTSILVSESTYLAARSRVVGRPIDIVQVKGRHAGVTVYELVCLAGEADAATEAMVAAADAALASYRGGDFRSALAAFERLRSIRADDRVAALFEERCRAYLETPPPAGWNGVYVATEK